MPLGRPLPGPARVRTTLAVAGTVTALALTTGAPGRADPYAAPESGPTIAALSAGDLPARYAASRRTIERALVTARQVRDGDRVRALTAFLEPGRRFLWFDARGGGRAVEVLGDLAGAGRVAVVVPGADGRLTNFDSVKWAGGGARALHRQIEGTAPGTRTAVIAWLGYQTPSTVSAGVLTSGGAERGARRLRRFLGGLHRVNGDAEIALLCHSYGSVVCGRAAREVAAARLPVDEIALLGSPGTTARTTRDLRTPATVWAGRAGGDWTRFVPHVRVGRLGFGADPLSPRFGAQVFDAGPGRHSQYFEPGSRPLRNLALIALGHDSEVTRA